MGYDTQTLSFDYTTVSLYLKPATSLVYLQWKDIHAHDNDELPIYGKYSAEATDYWEKNKYSWTMTIEKDGDSSTDVIVKDFHQFYIQTVLLLIKAIIHIRVESMEIH